jgi:hypothetical protein
MTEATASPVDSSAVSPESEKEIFSFGTSAGIDNDFYGDEELTAALDGLFDTGDLPEPEACIVGGSPFSLSDEELTSLGISTPAASSKQGLGAFASAEQDLEGTQKSAARAIAETLAALPVEEREQIVRDLYGISHNTSDNMNEDDPAFIRQKLGEMERELARMRKSLSWNLRLAAIELAESQNQSYVEDPDLRLKFIRADRYDTRKAAGRFIRFFDFKMELFGEKALARSITWNDLKPEDQAMLKEGYMQRLPIRDRAGRAIVCHIYNGQVYDSLESVARQCFYMGCHTDEVTDKKGHIAIFFKIKDFSFKRSSGTFANLYLMRCVSDLPTRFEAYHKMLEKNGNRIMQKIVDYITGIMAPGIRARSRVHEGNHEDWVGELVSFGIPHDVIPFSQSFRIKTKNHLEYVSMRIKAEEILARDSNTQTESLIDLPTRSDVLLGKGKPIQFSSGNQRLMTVVDGYLDQYHSKCNKQEKTALTFEIVRMLKESGVRFLSKDTGIWLEVPDDQARAKISYMFRHQRTKPNNGSVGVVRDSPSSGTIDSMGVATNENQNSTKRLRVES